MTDIYALSEGQSPLIISIPHSGTKVREDITKNFTAPARTLPDTDWHVDRLYAPYAQANDVTIIQAHYSRYVIDLNRPPDNAALYPGQTKVPLCPDQTFDGADIYESGHTPDDAAIARRLQTYWQPYHDELARQIERLKAKHGFAVLYDAHSIRSSVPRLFDGTLPDLNIGTADGKSCDEKLAQKIYRIADQSGFSAILNGRFIGGHITRSHGDPENHVHAIQMEIAQSAYMDEDSFAYDDAKAAKLIPVLEQILHAAAYGPAARVMPDTVG